jgi:hypothetical protein
MGKKRFEARGFAQEWAELKAKRDAKHAKEVTKHKAARHAAKATKAAEKPAEAKK